MHHKLCVLIVSGLAALLVSCSTRYVSQTDLGSYVQDESNGLKKQKELGGFTSTLTYRPRDFFIAQELEGIEVNDSIVDHYLKKYEAYYYFVWELSYQGREGLYAMGAETFSDNVRNLAFRMGDYASLTTNQRDTIPLADAIFPRTYGMSSSTTILMVFNAEEITDDDWVSVNIAEMGFGLGDQLFRFRKKDLDQIPRLKMLKAYLQ